MLEEALSGPIVNDTNWTSDYAQTILIATKEDVIWLSQQRMGGGSGPQASHEAAMIIMSALTLDQQAGWVFVRVIKAEVDIRAFLNKVKHTLNQDSFRTEKLRRVNGEGYFLSDLDQVHLIFCCRRPFQGLF